MKIKSSEEILSEIAKSISLIHNRPTMHVSLPRDGSADILESRLQFTYWLWAFTQFRLPELKRVEHHVRAAHKCRSLGFADSYRSQNHDAEEQNVCQHVLNCYADIARKMNLDISIDALEA